MVASEIRAIRVLIADDQRLFAEGVMNLLGADERIEVVGLAHNGAEATRLAESLRPDVVVMDIGMPGMDGIEATRQIKRRFPETVVMILTASDRPVDVERATEAGAAGYLTKDSASSDLITAVVEIAALATFAGPDQPND
jgi:DNA-binding NarL/FixJ family response regulator